MSGRRIEPKPLDRRRPVVSVVIPCFNYGHYVAGAVASVLDQPGITADVVLIDDASPDGSGEVVEALAKTDPRIRWVRHTVNRGHIATYNEGMDMCEGDYFVLLSADDLLTPGCLARATALMEAEPTVGLVYGHPLSFGDEVPRSSSEVRSWTVWSGAEWIARRCRSGHNVILSPEVVVRGSVQRRVGGYNADLPHAGDLEMWLRVAAVADVGRVNGANQAYYRLHDQSMSRTDQAGLLRDLRQRADAFTAVFAGPAGRFGDADALHDRARRTIAAQALDHACRAFDRGRTGEVPVGGLVELALELWPGARSLPQWRALQRRERIGPERAPHYPPFIARAAARRASEELRHWRWERTGAVGPPRAGPARLGMALASVRKAPMD